MRKTIPFSYHLYHRPTGKHYYGIKYSKGSTPDILWKTYFSSSKLVKQLILQFGVDSFDVEVRQIFLSGEKALLWEHKVLRRLKAASNSNWLNRHNGGPKWRAPNTASENQRIATSKMFKGVPKPESQKEKMREYAFKREQLRRESNWKMPKKSIDQALATRQQRIEEGKINPYSKERNQKMAKSKTGKKGYIDPKTGLKKMFTPGEEPFGFIRMKP